MKRPFIIILGIILVLILLGIWVYMLLTGSSNNQDQFAEFGFGDTTDPAAIGITPEENTEPVVDLSDQNPLRQLTTKPVVGFRQIAVDASSTPRVHYVEAGTGHTYSIDLESGEEKRITATTIPLAKKAALTPNGAHVFIQAGEERATEFIIGSLSTSSDELSNFALGESVTSFTATVENEFLYTTPNGNNTTAKAYNPRTNATRVLFTIPFREVAVDWHRTAAGPHLVYPKAASRLEGFVYSVTNGAMTRLPLSGYGLSASGGDTSVISSEVLTTSGDYVTTGYSYETGENIDMPISIIPEKCAFSPTIVGMAVCGISFTEYSDTMPNDWYRGTVSFGDGLWRAQPDAGAATLVSNVSDVTGRTVDIINPSFNGDGSIIYFQNKIDQTLWMYDFTK